MESAMLWVTVIGIIVLPILAWAFNTLITNKIDAIDKKQKEDRELFFNKLDEDRAIVETHYVRRDLYDQAAKFYLENTDDKFKSLLSIVNTQFQSMDNKLININDKMQEKMKDVKELEQKIDDVRRLINSKMN